MLVLDELEKDRFFLSFCNSFALLAFHNQGVHPGLGMLVFLIYRDVPCSPRRCCGVLAVCRWNLRRIKWCDSWLTPLLGIYQMHSRF